ncbi:hypothetical protein CYPRO_3278 [Cyclonatronum proteinivorum]|uniref:Outer membrane protein beta-barrel domain-containing protein n=1 Tax=Cyclonatronum proteinivorum TaxID=1457365 RepID=A0A345UPV9_9BACT|nr:hypothetical protein [Cyclonatronum proteinivorum]AXJ02511.1 hypothetical protein CYPRO_3278 [Cyclonatronum proteinivorum]
MKKLFTRLASVTLFLLCLSAAFTHTARAQHAGTWQFTVSPNLHIPFSMESEVTVLNITETFDLGLGDFLSLDQAFSGGFRLEGRRNDWGYFVDLSFTYAEDSRTARNYPLPPVLANVINTQFNPPVPVPAGTPVSAGILASGSSLSVDVGVLYRVWESEMRGGVRYYAEPSVAFRFGSIRSELDFELDLADIPVVRTKLDVSDNPGKAVIGLNLGIETEGRWDASLRTVTGTSVVSAEDHFSIRITPGAAYRLSDSMALNLNYDFHYLTYERRNNIGLKQTQHALSIGLTATF